MQTEHSPFPSDETLAAYIDGRLDEQTRKRVVAHIAECADCLDVVMASQEMPGAAEGETNVVRFPRWLTLGAAAAAVVVIALLIVPLRERYWPRADIGALAAVAPPQRVYDGRITGFPYRPHAPVMRGGEGEEPGQKPDAYRFLTVASRVADRAQKHRDAETLRAQGVAELVLGDQAGAVKDLEAAVQIEPSPTPQFLSDLAAAYIAANDQRAVAVAERAWKMEHTPEIAWNRALAAERFGSPQDAIAKWKDYLALDSKSRWAAEAREKHLARLAP